jgi:hypothetical protein
MATFADSPPSEGSDLRWLIEHLKMYPNSDEKPLRSTYSENILRQRPNFTQQQARPPTPAMSTSPPSSSEASPVTPQTPQFDDNLNPFYGNQAVINHFKDFGPMDDACYFPSRPASLPPSFITGFVRRTFTDDLCLVDFTQALTALDYLKVLENRRKHEIVAAIQRLGLSVHTTHAEREDWLRTHPEISNWVSGIECDERKVEALYTQVYIGLRRWVSNLNITLPLHFFKVRLTFVSDFDKRVTPCALQQSQLYCYAQYSLSPHASTSASYPSAYSSLACISAHPLLEIYWRCRAKRPSRPRND